MHYTLRPMTLADHDAVLQLMQATPGVVVRDADSREATARYLARNPGLSVVAERDGQLIGCLMAGHDGRRGYLQHLLVLPACRRHGIARAMVQHVITALESAGIHKSHVDVFRTNALGKQCWEQLGWTLRSDIDRYSLVHGGGENA